MVDIIETHLGSVIAFRSFLGKTMDNGFVCSYSILRGQQLIIGDKKYQSEGDVSDAFDKATTDALAFLNVTLKTFVDQYNLPGLVWTGSFLISATAEGNRLEKVLGASITNILSVLAKPYAKIILLAEMLAIPIAYYFTQQWLNTFAYHVDVSPWIFLIAGAIVILLSFLTISRQSLKAAKVNPIQWIRYESRWDFPFGKPLLFETTLSTFCIGKMSTLQ